MDAYKAKFTQELVSRWGKGEVSTTFVQYFEPNVTEKSLSKSALCHLADGVEAYLQLIAEDLFVKPPQFTENTIHMQPSFATTGYAFENRVPLFYEP